MRVDLDYICPADFVHIYMTIIKPNNVLLRFPEDELEYNSCEFFMCSYLNNTNKHAFLVANTISETPPV